MNRQENPPTFADNANSIDLRKIQIKSIEMNFALSLRPVYRFSRAFGLMPFTINLDGNYNFKETRVRPFDIAWFIISICFCTVMAIVYYQTIELPKGQNVSTILVIGDAMLIIVGLIYTCTIIVMDMLNRFKIIAILKMLNNFDNKMQTMNIHFNYKRKRLRIISWYIGTIIFSLFGSVVPFVTARHQNFEFFSFSGLNYFIANEFVHLIVATILTTYFVLIIVLHERFEVLNALLRKRFSNKNWTWTALHKEELISFIKCMGRQYDLLTRIMDRINFCYSLQVMVNIGAGFFFSILTFYSMYQYFRWESEFYGQKAYFHISYTLFYSIYACMVIHKGSSIACDGKMLARLVHSIINSCNDADVTFALNQLSQQIEHRYPVATCGLFAFDWSLAFNILSSIVTYITILINLESGFQDRTQI